MAGSVAVVPTGRCPVAEPQDGELFGEEKVYERFEEGADGHLMMVFFSRRRSGFPFLGWIISRNTETREARGVCLLGLCPTRAMREHDHRE